MTERNRESARTPEVCAHPDCICEIGAGAVVLKGKNYCSEGCAKGYGCNHADCLCGDSPGRTGRGTFDY